ncbi:MAG: efflux RND transporter periplasmic adaptor subunit [Burkholderiales bacterium]|nr:efflux RND transporter periplasmic adaptor subunit [Burkholderiales bacterium]
MQKRTVTLVAVGGLLIAGVVAYIVNNRGADIGAGEPKSAQTKAADAKSADAKAAPKGTDGKGDAKADAKAAGKGPPPAPVEVVTLKASRVQEDLGAVGTLRANQSVMLRTEVTGRVETIGFRDGQAVKRGQLLIGLDASFNEAEVAQAKAELALAQSSLKRTEDLAARNFVSSSAQDQAESNVAVLQARLQLAQARLSKMRVLAPFDGVVGIRAVNVGDVLRDGTDIVNIEDIRTLKVDFRVPERFFTQMKVGLPVEVAADALPGTTYRGSIEAINPRIDANGRSLELRASLGNSDGRLRPGMFARVRVVVGDRPEAFMVPEEAIVPQGDRFFVFRVAADGRAQRVPVRLGVRRDGQVELLDNVQAGDRIIVAGMRVQRDGQPVRVLGDAPRGNGAAGGAGAAGAPPADGKTAPRKADGPGGAAAAK